MMAEARVGGEASEEPLCDCGAEVFADEKDSDICASEKFCVEQVEALQQALVGGLRAGQGVAAFAGDDDEALGAASALGRGASRRGR